MSLDLTKAANFGPLDPEMEDLLAAEGVDFYVEPDDAIDAIMQAAKIGGLEQIRHLVRWR